MQAEKTEDCAKEIIENTSCGAFGGWGRFFLIQIFCKNYFN